VPAYRDAIVSVAIALSLLQGCSTRIEPSTSQPIRASAEVAPTFGYPAWTRLADAPDGRSHVAKAVLDGSIYLIGGVRPASAGGAGVTPAVQRFDPASRGWSVADPAPQALDHAAAAALGDAIFIFGGSFERPSAAAYRYEPPTHRWTSITAMPDPRAAGGAASVGGSIYVAGGFATRVDEPLTTAYRYDPVVDGWEAIPPLPTPRQHVAVVAYRGQACVLGGGTSAGGSSTAVECFDPAAGRWSALPSLPTPMSDFDAAVVGDFIICAGGGNQRGQLAYLFDGTAWRPLPNLGVSRYGVAVASVGRTVYVLQGSSVAPPYPFGVVESLTLP